MKKLNNIKTNNIISTKKVYLSLFLLLINSTLFAQEIYKSTPEKVPNKYTDYEILGKNNFGITLHYFGNGNHTLALYNNKLESITKKEISLNENGTLLESIMLQPNNIALFYSQNNGNKQYLKIKKLNKNLDISTTPILIDSITSISYNSFQPYYVRTSTDKSKILVFSVIENEANFRIKFIILNTNYEVIAKSQFAVNTKKHTLKSIRIADNGNIVAVAAHENKWSDEYEYDFDNFTIFTYNLEQKLIAENEINTENYQYKNFLCEINNTKDFVYITACYKNKTNLKDIGILYKILDLRTNTFAISNTIILDDKNELLKSNTYNFKNWEEKASIVKPKKIMPRSDGGFILITESDYKYTTILRSPNPSSYYNADQIIRYDNSYHYYDIFAYSINTDGTIDWTIDIPKSQKSENDNGAFSSFAFFESNNILKFLYNEDFTKNGNFVEQNIIPNGISKRLSILNTEKLKLALVPKKAKQLDGNTILFPSEDKRNIQLILLKYK